MDSLALATKKAYEHTTLSSTVLQEGNVHRAPVTAFLPDGAFPHVPASALVCQGKTTPLNEWSTCQIDAHPDYRIKHRVVLIGLGENTNNADSWHNVLGETPGYVMQASYIESLLDDRFMWQVSSGTQFFLNLVLFALVQLCFLLSGEHFLKALAFACALWVVAGLLSLLTAVALGWYFNVWVSCLTAIGILFLHKVSEWTRSRASRHAASK
jgi:CHASE2 domain-containing sensor protein